MHSCAVKLGLITCFVAALAGCGGGGTPSPNNPNSTTTVAQVTLTPSSISVVAGEVVTVSASAVNSSGNAISPIPTITFNSSNTQVATVSPGGLVCGGVWDSFFIVCNGTNAQGNPVAGTALITASSGGVSSAPSTATVHPSVTGITIKQISGNALPGCNSVKQTSQLKATVFHNGTDITSLVGPVSWSSSAAAVASVDANGVATAGAPGLTSIVASVGTVSSFFFNLKTCMPIQITLHLNGDPAGKPTESATMNVTDTLTIEADMVDEQGVTTNSAPVTILSNNTEIASVAGVTLTAESPGGASLVAVCAPPSCGAGLNTPVYSNIFSVAVVGGSPTTVVYATSSFAPPSTSPSPSLVPIDTSKSPIVAGTPIPLPGVPNSLVFTANGATGYMGTNQGIVTFNTASNAVTIVDPFVGKVLAISPDGSTVILSNAPINDPATGNPFPAASQRLVILTASNNTLQSFVLPGAIAASFTSDSSKAYIAVNDGGAQDNGRVYIFSNFQTLQTTFALAGAPVTSDVATVASGEYSYYATQSGLQVVATCNNTQQPTANNPPTNTNTLQLVGSAGNQNLIVAVDTTGINIETVTLNSIFSTNPALPFTLTQANCAPPVSYSNQFLDFGIGPFTARQLLMPTNSVSNQTGAHIVVFPVGLPEILAAIPGSGSEVIPLAGSGTEVVSGSMTLDANIAWVGVAGSNDVHEIMLQNAPSGADVLQIPMSFKKSDGTPAPPDIVVVKPH